MTVFDKHRPPESPDVPGYCDQGVPLLYPANVSRLPAETLTLPKRLKTAGYTTCHIGKWHLGGKGSMHGFPTI